MSEKNGAGGLTDARAPKCKYRWAELPLSVALAKPRLCPPLSAANQGRGSLNYGTGRQK